LTFMHCGSIVTIYNHVVNFLNILMQSKYSTICCNAYFLIESFIGSICNIVCAYCFYKLHMKDHAVFYNTGITCIAKYIICSGLGQ
jgi:hypothetical protein